MANVRDFKKDIDYVVNELVIECFTYNFIFPEKNKDNIATIISEVIEMGNDLLKKVNEVKPTKDNSAKAQFKLIRKEFTSNVESFIEKLDKLEKE
ncbi:MAG: hypothetical protein PF517_20815 [Salinivirgaceae bacterium]|jgi:hypothetical protein|nr:hypothetical protein [Salinivirgaceae bacterium]